MDFLLYHTVSERETSSVFPPSANKHVNPTFIGNSIYFLSPLIFICWSYMEYCVEETLDVDKMIFLKLFVHHFILYYPIINRRQK